MKLMRRALPLCAALTLSSTAFAIDEEVDQNDLQVLREWINTKRQVTVKELGGALSISGEVRTEFQRTREKRSGKNQRGHNSPCSVPNQAYDVEVNLMMDYRQDRSWASIKIEFDNNAGVFNATVDRLKLERAYFGLRAVDGDTAILDIEIGRRRIATILDSKVQFDSFFDGIFLKYDQELEQVGDVYAHVGVFLINERADHYGYLGEFGIMNAGNTGFYAKYSLIDWDTKHFKTPVRNDIFRFLVSQVILGYRFQPTKWSKAAIAYAAGVWNHAAKRLPITGERRANYGAYIGFTLGELKKRNDWALDINYQLLAPQAVPDFDTLGIGLGNACRSGFYATGKFDAPGLVVNTQKTAGGNVNYQGYVVTLDYLLTNNLDLQQSWQQSRTFWKSVGPFRHYNQYEIELIYAF